MRATFSLARATNSCGTPREARLSGWFSRIRRFHTARISSSVAARETPSTPYASGSSGTFERGGAEPRARSQAALVEAEGAPRAREKIRLARIDGPVRAGDREQGGQHVLEHAAIVGERLAELLGVAFEPLRAVARLVEQPPDITHGFRRDAELALEGVDFQPRHGSVALRELGRQHHDADREQLVAPAQKRRQTRGVEREIAEARPHVGGGAVVGGVTERRAHHRTEWPSHGKSRHAANDLAPVAHSSPSLGAPACNTLAPAAAKRRLARCPAALQSGRLAHGRNRRLYILRDGKVRPVLL